MSTKTQTTSARNTARMRAAIDRHRLLETMLQYGWDEDALITISERMKWNLACMKELIIELGLIEKAEAKIAYFKAKEEAKRVENAERLPDPTHTVSVPAVSVPVAYAVESPAPARSRVDYLLDEIRETYIRKNHDYGDSFSRSISSFGLVAAAVRMNDKWNRAENLMKGAARMVKDETLRDTLMDLANYCIMTVQEMDRNDRTTEYGGHV